MLLILVWLVLTPAPQPSTSIATGRTEVAPIVITSDPYAIPLEATVTEPTVPQPTTTDEPRFVPVALPVDTKADAVAATLQACTYSHSVNDGAAEDLCGQLLDANGLGFVCDSDAADANCKVYAL